MGWLRDLMGAAPSGVRSFDELAKSCLKNSDWPADSSMHHRSLGAILGRLDRDTSSDWLTSRPAVQQVLAEVLGVPRGSLLAALRPRTAAPADRLVTWSAMPLARGLDLVEEDLFPGIPIEVLRPARWDRLVWVAPSGGGRSLAGQWLVARGLAEHADLTTGADPWPAKGPFLVELGSPRQLAADQLGPGFCVAVPEPWEPPPGFGACTVVRSPPLVELIGPLVDWACDRLAKSSRASSDRLVPALLTLLELGVIASAGDVLGLVGLADAEGMELLEDPTLERAVRAWLRKRARERLDPEAPETAWVRRSGFETLGALVRRVATDSEDPLFCPRSFEDWSELLPESARHGPDLEWLKLALPRADPNLRLATLERATEKLPPGAFRVLRCFEHLGVLERRDGDLLALRPHWLLRAAESAALEALVTGPSFDWGEALLSPRMARRTMERLVASARTRTLPLDELIEPEASRDVGYAAAIEGAVRALGAAELLGTHAGSDALETLWNEQLRLIVTLPDGAVVPRVEHTGAAKLNGGFWLTRGGWYLAMLTLGEALEAHQGERHALLRPWQATDPPAGIAALLDAIAVALERPDVPREVVGPAIGLISRLGALLGPLGEARQRHRLERAVTMADEAAVGVLAWSSVAALASDRVGCIGLAHLIGVRRLEPRVLAEQTWQAFESAGWPGSEAGALLSPEVAPLVMPFAPNTALVALAKEIVSLDVPPVLAPSQWLAVLGGELTHAPAAFFRRIPDGLVEGALDAACRSEHREGLVALWSRAAPVLTRALVSELLAAPLTSGRQLLFETAPPAVIPDVLARLPDASALLRGPIRTLETVRRFLHVQIAARAPGFRNAHALLDELETRLAAVHSYS